MLQWHQSRGVVTLDMDEGHCLWQQLLPATYIHCGPIVDPMYIPSDVTHASRYYMCSYSQDTLQATPHTRQPDILPSQHPQECVCCCLLQYAAICYACS